MTKTHYDHLKVGQSACFSECVTPEKFDLYVSISKDNSSIHSDDVFAQSKGYKEKIVHAMLYSSFYSTLVGCYLPKFGVCCDFKITCNNPLYVNEAFKVYGEITKKDDTFKLVEVSAKIFTQEKVISKAKITVAITE